MSDDIRHEYTVRSTQLLVSVGNLLRVLGTKTGLAPIGDCVDDLRLRYQQVCQTLQRATASDLVSDMEREALVSGIQSLATDGDR